jgi:hypothetical protein
MIEVLNFCVDDGSATRAGVVMGRRPSVGRRPTAIFCDLFEVELSIFEDLRPGPTFIRIEWGAVVLAVG